MIMGITMKDLTIIKILVIKITKISSRHSYENSK